MLVQCGGVGRKSVLVDNINRHSLQGASQNSMANCCCPLACGIVRSRRLLFNDGDIDCGKISQQPKESKEKESEDEEA